MYDSFLQIRKGDRNNYYGIVILFLYNNICRDPSLELSCSEISNDKSQCNFFGEKYIK